MGEEPQGFGKFSNYVESEVDNDESQMQFVDTRPLVTKTPISFLQELCVKKQMTPIYEMLASEGQVHEPTFIYRVIVGDMSAIGQGKSKKVAKHNAAKNLLENIVAKDLYQDWLLYGETREEAYEYLHSIIPEIGSSATKSPPKAEQPTASASVDVAVDLANIALEDAEGGANPIGKLQEMCLGRRWPPPRYDLIEESGMPHDKTFIITVYLGKFEQTGQGKSKKGAKRVAAERMLKFLHELPAHKQDEELAIDEDNQEDELDNNAEAPNLDLEEQLSALASEQQQWGSFGNGFQMEPPTRRTLSELLEMDLSTEKPSLKCKQMLQAIAEEEKWAVKYTRMERQTKQGLYQCLVNFADTAVCHGTGATPQEAEWEAALHGLEYLKVTAIL